MLFRKRKNRIETICSAGTCENNCEVDLTRNECMKIIKMLEKRLRSEKG